MLIKRFCLILFLCFLGVTSTNLKDGSKVLNFFFLGDWGGLPSYPYKTFVEVSVAKQMAILAKKFNPEFILALGDNFYFDGIKNFGDPRIKESYEDVFSLPALKTIPWVVIAGNHDHHGNVSAQIEYTRFSKRWFFPDYYFKKTATIPGTDVTVDILMIDTVLICGNNAHDDETGQPIPNLLSEKYSDKQLAWIEKNLASSKANYLIVAGHFPVYSVASHGSTECLVEKLNPLLEKYRVNAFLCGHDHTFQHISPENSVWTVEHFVAGCANFIEYSTIHRHTIPKGSLKYFWADMFSLGGFALASVYPENMTVTYYESNGKVLYQYAMKPRL